MIIFFYVWCLFLEIYLDQDLNTSYYINCNLMCFNSLILNSPLCFSEELLGKLSPLLKLSLSLYNDTEST